MVQAQIINFKFGKYLELDRRYRTELNRSNCPPGGTKFWGDNSKIAQPPRRQHTPLQGGQIISALYRLRFGGGDKQNWGGQGTVRPI